MNDTNDTHRRIGAALSRLGQVVAAATRRAAESEGLSNLQLGILQRLESHGERRVGELAQELDLAPATVSVALRSLESKGLIAKERDPSEHRSVVVRPTRKGRNAVRRTAGWSDERLEPLVGTLGEADSGQVLAGLLTLLRAAEREGWIEGTRMCASCEYFRPWGGRRPAGERPHRCAPLEADLRPLDLRVDCADFVGASPEELDRRPDPLSPPA